MRVLVTGHLGYIGTVLVPVLLDAGHEVVGLDTDLYADCTFGPPEAIRAVPSVGGDLRDVTEADLDGIDAVIHLAALSNDPLGDLDRDLTLEINHRASVRLANVAKAAGVSRFVFSSSCSNYGAAGGLDLLDESAELHPITAYGESKVLVERDVAPLADDRFSPVFLRNATAYGVSPRLRCDIVLNNLVGWAYTTGRVRLKSDGTPWRPLVHVEDIARAALAAIEAPRDAVHGQAFNVGSSDENYRIRDLAEIVESVVPDCHIELAPDASPDARDYRVDASRFAKAVGFRTRHTARDGAVELLEAYRRNGLTLDELEGARYMRIAQVRALQADGRIDDRLRRTAVSSPSDGG